MDASAVAMKKQAQGLQAAYEQLSADKDSSNNKNKSSGSDSNNSVAEQLDKISKENIELLDSVKELSNEKKSLQLQCDVLQKQAPGKRLEWPQLSKIWINN